MCLLGVNFYKQIFECYDKIKGNSENEVIEKCEKLLKKVAIAIQIRDKEYQEAYSVVHEIRLFDFLRKKCDNVKMHTDKTAGPDLECDFGYIECVSITKGEGKNRVEFEQIMNRRVNRYKAGETRITTALMNKRTAYAKYISSNTLKNEKPRIIAISTSLLSNEVHHILSSDLIKKILFGIDTQVIRIGGNEKKIIDTFFTYNTIAKKNDIQFETGYFWKDNFRDISAVILNHNAFTEDITDSYFEIYLNPNASLPIDTKKIQKFNYFYMKSKTENEIVFETHNP